MFYTSLLTAHLIVAAVTGIAASFAGVAMVTKSEKMFRPMTLILAGLASFEILSGTILSIISSKVTALSLCSNIVIYLSIVFAVEALLFLRMKKVSLAFPLLTVASPTVFSLAFFVSALAWGF